MMDVFRYDFDYTWPWTYGHVLAAAVFAAAGFEVVEQGTAPATLYLLARNARD